MKKFVLVSLLLSIGCVAFAQNAETNEELVNEKKEVSRHYVDPSNFSHWSIALTGGFNMFLGERGINMTNENNGFNAYRQNFAFGANAQVEYMVNPYWGILLQYQFAPVNKKGLSQEVKESLQIDKNPTAHEISFQGIVNLLNLFRTYHKYTKWNVYAKLGAGAILYPYKQKSGDDINTITRRSVVLPFGFSVEYSPIKSLGIFFDTQCRWYYVDDINYVVGGQHYDMALYGGLGLRYHIGATKKPHVRVMSLATYDSFIPSDGEKLSASNDDNPSLDSLQKQMQKINDDLEKIKDNQDELGKQGNENADKIKALQDNVDKLVNDLNKGQYNPKQIMPSRTQSYLDGAPDVNDPYYEVRSNINNVFFAFDKYNLTDYEKSKIDMIVKLLNEDPNAKINICAYCDPRGTNAYNKRLSLNRANTVVKYLVKSGIERNRIIKRYKAGVLDKTYPHELNRVCTLDIK